MFLNHVADHIGLLNLTSSAKLELIISYTFDHVAADKKFQHTSNVSFTELESREWCTDLQCALWCCVEQHAQELKFEHENMSGKARQSV